MNAVPLEWGYLWCGCQKKADRLSPVPGISNPSSPPIPGTGPSASENEVYEFPTSPPTAVGTGGAGSCVALIVRCPGFVAVYHFTGGDDPTSTIRRLNWPSVCDAMICRGDPRDPQSDCLGEEVANVAKAKFNLVGISGNSGCGVDENGNFYQYGN